MHSIDQLSHCRAHAIPRDRNETPRARSGASVSPGHQNSRARAIRDSGFTLLELLVVLAIIALTITVSVGSIRSSGGVVRVQPLAVRVAADLRLARADAIAQSRPVEVIFDAKAHAYSIGGAGAAVKLPAGIAFTLVTSQEFQRSVDRARLVFFPDGSSTGGQLTLTDRRLDIVLSIDWLTGTVNARRVLR